MINVIRKITGLILVMLFSLSTIAMTGKPESYNIFYLPLEAEFYVPPTREYIMQHGTKFEMTSPALTSLFTIISNKDGVEPKSEYLKSLRVLVRKNDGEELLITSDKRILSGSKKHDVEEKVVDGILKEMANVIKNWRFRVWHGYRSNPPQ